MAADVRYDDPCGIARAMGVIGDRWAVLVVRELMFGPRRFAQLRTALVDISPNVLAQRLRDLEASGVVRRVVLDESAAVTAYELTDRGRDLEAVLIELGRWGSREPNRSQRELSLAALMFSFRTVFDPRRATDGVYGIRVGDEGCTVTVTDRRLTVGRGVDPSADVVLDTDIATLRAVAFGRESPTAATQAGRLRITGNRSLAGRFGRMFPVPTRIVEF